MENGQKGDHNPQNSLQNNETPFGLSLKSSNIRVSVDMRETNQAESRTDHQSVDQMLDEGGVNQRQGTFKQAQRANQRRQTLKGKGEPDKDPEKDEQNKKERCDNIEARSFFRCCFNRRHLDEDVTDWEEDDKAKRIRKSQGCPMCSAQIKMQQRFELKKVQKSEFFKGEEMQFKDFIKSLIPNPKDNPKEKMIKGCQVFFPDTLFFEKGKPSFIVQNDKDFCLAKVSEASETNGKGL